MNSLLHYAAPPVLGAFIGYMTNYVAIKMLFRPLKKWHVFGIPVPMTPGVIPSKREMLAENIGEMVGEHLLTAKDVKHAITSSRFQNKLKNMIDARVRLLMQQNLGPVTSVIPNRFKNYFDAMAKILRLRIIKLMNQYLDSEEFGIAVESLLSGQMNVFLAKEVQTLLPEKEQEHFYAFLETTLARFMAGPGVTDWAEKTVNVTIDQFLADERPLSDLIPAEIRGFMLDKMEKETPHVLHKMAELLEEPAMRDKIDTTICKAIDTFTASLGPMAALIENFIDSDTISEKVNDYLNNKGEEISSLLFDEAVQKKISAIIRAKAEEIMAKPCSSLLAKAGPEQIAEIRATFCRQATQMLTNPQTSRSLTLLLRQGLETQSHRPLAEILKDLFGETALGKGKKNTAREIIAAIRSAKVKKMLDTVVVDTIQKKMLAKPIGPLTAILPREVRTSFADYILMQLSDLLIREIPGLVNSLNIRKIVTRKVNSLDLLRLERLLMSIMQEQFKYINLFGGLLGFMIGLLNLLLLSL